MTDLLGNLLSFLDNITFPGAWANAVFEVMIAQITVLMLLLLKASDCNIKTGRL